MDKALEGIKVLDLGRIQAAPYCAQILGDMGADVIKIEVPGTGDDARDYLPKRTYFSQFNRSKRGMTLNLKSEKGKEILKRLVREADVLIENYRPGIMTKLGLDYYEVLCKINPGLIYCAISSFGQTGPYAQKAGFDPLLQAMTGIMTVTGFPDGEPVRAGIAVSDILGGLNGAIGILAALQYRHQTGKGQFVDVALADADISAMSSINVNYLENRTIRGRMGNSYGTGAPGGKFDASDGSFMYAAANDGAWRKICNEMGHPEYIDDPRFISRESRAAHRPEVDKIMNDWCKTRTVAENVALFDRLKLAAGPIQNVEQVYNDPHFGKNGEHPMFFEFEHPTLGTVEYTGPAIGMSETPLDCQLPSPDLGQHNKEILTALGYTEEEITAFYENGTI